MFCRQPVLDEWKHWALALILSQRPLKLPLDSVTNTRRKTGGCSKAHLSADYALSELTVLQGQVIFSDVRLPFGR